MLGHSAYDVASTADLETADAALLRYRFPIVIDSDHHPTPDRNGPATRQLDWTIHAAATDPKAWIDIDNGNLVLIEAVGFQTEDRGVISGKLYIAAADHIVEISPEKHFLAAQDGSVPSFHEAAAAALRDVVSAVPGLSATSSRVELSPSDSDPPRGPQEPNTDLHPAILARWNYLGREASVVGVPAGPETRTADGGVVQPFTTGTIAWREDIGAQAVYGAINERWLALGGPTFGYPVTEELDSPGGGRYNDFAAPGSTTATSSIYWAPHTGAWEVYGRIRTYWIENGGAGGLFGYPVDGEHDSGEFRMQTFDHEVAYYQTDTPGIGRYGR